MHCQFFSLTLAHHCFVAAACRRAQPAEPGVQGGRGRRRGAAGGAARLAAGPLPAAALQVCVCLCVCVCLWWVGLGPGAGGKQASQLLMPCTVQYRCGWVCGAEELAGNCRLPRKLPSTTCTHAPLPPPPPPHFLLPIPLLSCGIATVARSCVLYNYHRPTPPTLQGSAVGDLVCGRQRAPRPPAPGGSAVCGGGVAGAAAGGAGPRDGPPGRLGGRRRQRRGAGSRPGQPRPGWRRRRR
jgi:hypothetical protein